MVLRIFFAAVFIASVVVAAYQLWEGVGFGVGTWFPPLYFALLFAAACASGHLKNKKALKRLHKPLMRIFYSAMAVFCAAFVVVCAYIMSYPEGYIHGDPDVVIVLGTQTIGYEPGRTLAARLDAAAETLGRHPGALCITAGGQGPDAIAPEAYIMRRYLMNHGIDGERIFMENRSSDTFQNLLLSRELMERYGIAAGRIAVVTSEFHIPRAMMLARRVFGGAHIYAVKSDTPLALFSAGITREFFAFVKSFVFDRE